MYINQTNKNIKKYSKYKYNFKTICNKQRSYFWILINNLKFGLAAQILNRPLYYYNLFISTAINSYFILKNVYKQTVALPLELARDVYVDEALVIGPQRLDVGNLVALRVQVVFAEEYE